LPEFQDRADMGDRLGKVIHVEGGYTVVEVLDAAEGQSGRILGYSLFGVGTDIRRGYTREAAIAALHEHLAAA
jgi:hypothetical protein